MTYAFMADEPPPPRRKGRVNWLIVGAILVLAAIVAVTLLRPSTVSERQRNDKTVRVVLPPPPPPPPPPEVQPVERPPEPTPTPMDQPVEDTPPPPDASNEPTVGDNALTAREGAGPSNYGLARGDGSGSRIGGRPGGGGDAFAAYANGVVTPCVRQATQADRELRRGSYTARLSVAVDASGRIASVRPSTGDARRDARLREVLQGHQCAGRTPPAGLPTMNIELNARAAG